MLFCAVTSVLLQLTSCSFDFSWFKNTTYHEENIDVIKNVGWKRCPDWQYEFYEEGAGEYDVEINLGLFSPITPSFTMPKPRNDKFNFTARCITIQVPLFWDSSYYTNDSSLKTIDYFMARVYSRDNENNTANNGAFWILTGGPGGDGVSMYDTAIPWLNFINSTFDAYIPDHRGTGSSGHIKCPIVFTAEQCTQFMKYKYGNDTYAYSTKYAAIDLGYTIDLFNENMDAYNNENTIIYGISYGTYYLNIYLQLFPNQANAVILDGICPPDKCRWVTYDEKGNSVGLDFLDKCDANQFCSEQFEEYNYSSKNALRRIYQQAANNNNIVPCFTDCDLDRTQFKKYLYSLLSDEYKRALIPPLIRRITRCNVDDQDVLNYFLCPSPSTPSSNTTSSWPFTASPTTATTTTTSFTTYRNYSDDELNSRLFSNIVNSEMYYGLDPRDPGPSAEQLDNLSETYYFATGLINGEIRKEWDVWNKYMPDDTYYLNYADPSVPMLILNGDLDPQTPLEWAISSAMEYGANMNDDTVDPKNRYYYTVPWAPHFVFYRSAIKNYTDYRIEYEKQTETCGFYLIASFIDPQRNWVPDSSCINWLLGIDWVGRNNITMQISLRAFATINMWEGGKNGTASPSMSPTFNPTEFPISYDDSGISEGGIIGVIVACLALLCLVGFIGDYYYNKLQKSKINSNQVSYGAMQEENA